jgi:hypothetical protein
MWQVVSGTANLLVILVASRRTDLNWIATWSSSSSRSQRAVLAKAREQRPEDAWRAGSIKRLGAQESWVEGKVAG